eukprot:5720832-Amphidinium_carterae.1
MLSGRSTVVAARCDTPWGALRWDAEGILSCCCRRLGLAGDGRMELWHTSDRVPDDTAVNDWPGIKPCGEIS